MENFRFEDKEVEFWKVSGEVLDQQKYSETHVSSSGGGGYVGPNGGHVSAPTVYSTALTKHEFWLKTEDGNEKAIQLSGVDIPLRHGQKVTVISAKRTDKENGLHVAIINHTANDYRLVENGKSLNDKFSLIFSWGRSLLITGFWGMLCLFFYESFKRSFSAAVNSRFLPYETASQYFERTKTSGFFDPNTVAMLLAASTAVVFFWAFLSKAKRRENLEKSLTAHIKNLSHNALK